MRIACAPFFTFCMVLRTRVPAALFPRSCFAASASESVNSSIIPCSISCTDIMPTLHATVIISYAYIIHYFRPSPRNLRRQITNVGATQPFWPLQLAKVGYHMVVRNYHMMSSTCKRLITLGLHWARACERGIDIMARPRAI